MNLLWFHLSIFVIISVDLASPTTEVPTFEKNMVEISEKEKNSLNVGNCNKSANDFNFLYGNQIENIDNDIDVSIENSVLWILQGDSSRAAKRFNTIPNNILRIKAVVGKVLSEGLNNMPQLLDFVEFLEGYEQKILMTIILYTEFVKSIDINLLPKFQASIEKLISMSKFDGLDIYYRDQLTTMKTVLKALFEKVEAFIPKEKPEEAALRQIKDNLSDLIMLTNETHQQQTGNTNDYKRINKLLGYFSSNPISTIFATSGNKGPKPK